MFFSSKIGLLKLLCMALESFRKSKSVREHGCMTRTNAKFTLAKTP